MKVWVYLYLSGRTGSGTDAPGAPDMDHIVHGVAIYRWVIGLEQIGEYDKKESRQHAPFVLSEIFTERE